jgi:hypothetical protein
MAHALRQTQGGQDVWALGVIALILAAGLDACTWLVKRKPQEVLPCLEKLLGVIDATVWPGHEKLPLWSIPLSVAVQTSVGEFICIKD